MNRWTIDSSRPDHNYSAFDSIGVHERKRGMTVELLVGGFHIPGFIEYCASDDQVTFTIIKKVPLLDLGDS